MRRLQNTSRYDKYQMLFARFMIEQVRSAVEHSGVSVEKIEQTVESIVWSLSTMLDGAALIPLGDDDHLVPFLGFAVGNMRDRLLVPEGGGGSWIHEYTFALVQDHFAAHPIGRSQDSNSAA